MSCPRCRSNNVTFTFVQTGAKSTHKGVGLGGHLNNAARGLTAVGTLGASNLFWKKSKGGTTTTFKNEKIFICQDCGYDWKEGGLADAVGVFKDVKEAREARKEQKRLKEQNPGYNVFQCPGCGMNMRVPKGAGKVRVTCRQCGTSFEKKT